MRCRNFALSIVIVMLVAVSIGTVHAQITSPEDFFGFKPGTDKKMVRWDQNVKYFEKLETESDRIKVMHMGPSTMGNPFLVLLISSPENLANLDQLQKSNKGLSDPRGIDKNIIEKYIRTGKAVICQSYGLHSSEVGGTQSTPNITHALLSGNDEETKRILDNVLFFMIPCFNPDGDIMIHDWYTKNVGTRYDGISMPWLYHKYIGHDTNRDGDFLNMIESQYAAEIMYVDWPAQAFIDHHQMGSYGARFYVPPYCEPIRPFADPLIWREISWYGSHIAYKLEEEGIKGVINSAVFSGWGHFGWHWITPFHNIAGMLTESASANLASPLYIHPEQLKGGSRAFPEYKAQSTFPNPWKGGWWRLGDIVRQKEIASMALLDHAARNRETILRNAYQKAVRQIERGKSGNVNTVIIPANQHDKLTTIKMINTLLKSGIEIRLTKSDFIVDDRVYKKGAYLITLAQPKMGLIRNLLMETRYADNDWTHNKDGSVLRPYDLSTHTMNEFMGVKTEAVKIDNLPASRVLAGPVLTKGNVAENARFYLLDGRLNNSYTAVNLLLNKKIKVDRITEADEGFRQGDFLLQNSDVKQLLEIAAQTGVDFQKINVYPQNVRPVKRQRTGMYRRYWGGNMDEGWTRFLLDQNAFAYTTLRDAVIKKGNLHKKFDVIILPSDSPGMITGEIPERYRRWISTDIPEKYKSGIGKEGKEALKEFVKNGGTLVTLDRSWKFAAETFDLKVTNVVEDLQSNIFFCSGSTLHAHFDNTHPLAWGMPEKGLILNTGSPVFEIIPGRENHLYKTLVRYVEEDVLKSGWLIGEDKIARKSALVIARYGEGEVVLIGFRTQHRAQTHGTFKFLFNALFKS
ncbi:peptidase M14 family protein [bacterium]|nr:peptidase M14 family protein [bacterium]